MWQWGSSVYARTPGLPCERARARFPAAGCLTAVSGDERSNRASAEGSEQKCEPVAHGEVLQAASRKAVMIAVAVAGMAVHIGGLLLDGC